MVLLHLWKIMSTLLDARFRFYKHDFHNTCILALLKDGLSFGAATHLSVEITQIPDIQISNSL